MNGAYDVIADRIIEMLDKGVVPWRKPWVGGAASCAAFCSTWARNIVQQQDIKLGMAAVPAGV